MGVCVHVLWEVVIFTPSILATTAALASCVPSYCAPPSLASTVLEESSKVVTRRALLSLLSLVLAGPSPVLDCHLPAGQLQLHNQESQFTFKRWFFGLDRTLNKEEIVKTVCDFVGHLELPE
ncbi:hypothetical protein Syun_023718 [Stephania yunnanensis]|uniref:Uncharacterized protein n=1 Tax=Stephania yunnanensis TaxID=152371 RepID=A0AAP0FD29_9MAGN